MSNFNSKRPRTFQWIIFWKTFFFRLKWNLSENFSSFVEIFQQNRQKWISRVQTNTMTKIFCWLCETIFDFGQINVWFVAENLQPCYQICTFVSRWAIGRIVLKEFLFFWFFWTSREHFCFFLLYHSKHGGPNWISLAKRNISTKKNFVRKLFVVSVLWAHFLNIHWSLLAMLSKLQFTCS